jgi:GTP-binding protein
MVDVTKVLVKGGDGGNGSFSFRREKYIPKGGPDGGDGGDGGTVTFVTDTTKRTLDDLAGVRKIAAQNGENGHAQQSSGRKGDDVEVGLPPGTVVWELDPETHNKMHKLGEILNEGDRLLVAYGGKGGRGNQHFKSSRNQTPMEYEMGGDGDERLLLLELKLLADLGFVGFPNAGKSTLLSVVTKARPKIANYPFTTLEPHLGVMDIERGSGTTQRYVVADIPGLIEEASSGKGLGHKFLRHIERCRLLIYLLYVDDEMLLDSAIDDDTRAAAILQQYETLHKELQQHDEELARRPSLVVLNKIDVLSPELIEMIQARWKEQHPDIELHLLSGATQRGLPELQQKIDQRMQQLEAEESSAPRTSDSVEIPVYSLPSKEDHRRPKKAIRPPLKKMG